MNNNKDNATANIPLHKRFRVEKSSAILLVFSFTSLKKKEKVKHEFLMHL